MSDYMKIYIASAYENKGWANILACLLRLRFNTSVNSDFKVNIVSSWHTAPVGLNDPNEQGKVDIGDLDTADLVILVYPHGYNSAGEAYYAVAKGIPVLYLIEEEFLDDALNLVCKTGTINSVEELLKQIGQLHRHNQIRA